MGIWPLYYASGKTRRWLPIGTARQTYPGTPGPDASITEQNDAYYTVFMQTISLKLPEDLMNELTSEAKARRTTKSQVVRDSLEKALRKQPAGTEVSCYDLARDLAGTVKGLPKDLADNPKYMEGFGE
jgi:hypothetical protein